MADKVQKTIELIEGFRATAYPDAGGHSTGFGHFIKPGEEELLTKKLTREEGNTLLKQDIAAHQTGLNEWLKRPMSELKKAAITSLAYNTAAKGTGVKKIVDLYNQGKDKEAAEVFARYNKSYNPATKTKEVNPDLVKRREFEKAMFLASDDASVEEIHQEFYGSKKSKKPEIMASRSVTPKGAREVAMNDNKNVYAQLQQLNLGLKETGFGNSEFMQRLRREGGNGGLS